jgi:hypothetical protein
MPHPLIDQLHFARSEFARCLAGVSDEEAARRVGPMNCLSWFIGHMANHEYGFWVYLPQGTTTPPEPLDLGGWGNPGGTPPLETVWAAWLERTAAADRFLDRLTTADLDRFFVHDGQQVPESTGTLLYRTIYHYWFHTGEAHGVRQALGHTGLPDFVGDMNQARYRPEGS